MVAYGINANRGCQWLDGSVRSSSAFRYSGRR